MALSAAIYLKKEKSILKIGSNYFQYLWICISKKSPKNTVKGKTIKILIIRKYQTDFTKQR